MKSSYASGYGQESQGSSLQSVIRKSALLNLTIILTAFPVLFFAGGPDAVVPTLILMAAISVLIWALTFTLFSFVSLARIFLRLVLPGSGPPSIDERMKPGWRIAGWTRRSDGRRLQQPAADIHESYQK